VQAHSLNIPNFQWGWVNPLTLSALGTPVAQMFGKWPRVCRCLWELGADFFPDSGEENVFTATDGTRLRRCGLFRAMNRDAAAITCLCQHRRLSLTQTAADAGASISAVNLPATSYATLVKPRFNDLRPSFHTRLTSGAVGAIRPHSLSSLYLWLWAPLIHHRTVENNTMAIREAKNNNTTYT